MYYQQFPGALPAGGTTLTAAAETAYITAQPSTQPAQEESQGIVIKGMICATGGATGGVWSVKCRRGTGVAGAQVGITQTITFPATTTLTFPYSFNDPAQLPPAVGGATTFPVGLVYTVTVTAVGSNGTAVDGSMEILTPSVGVVAD